MIKMISIALATYNGEKYLREQLDSILSQTIQDFEIVICDDYSTDSTWDILQEYIIEDNRIKIYQNAENVGFKKNFEKAISLCKGEYIALSDQDDIWTKGHLEHLISIIGDKAIACGNAALINRLGGDIGITLSELERLEYCPENDLRKAYRILFFGNPFQGASMLIRKNFFEKALPIPDGVKYHDAWFACMACFYGGLNFSEKVVTFYRQHDNNASYHEEWSFLSSFIRFQSASKLMSDRLCMVEELCNRLDILTGEPRELLLEALRFHKRKMVWYQRLKNAVFIIRHYSDIYSTKSMKLFLPRVIKNLI